MGGADGHHTAGHQGQGLVSAWGQGLGEEPDSGTPLPPCPPSPRPYWALPLCLQVCSQARLRVQVPAVCSAPFISACTSGDLPARPSNHPAEERCQVEGGVWARRRAGGTLPEAETVATRPGFRSQLCCFPPGLRLLRALKYIGEMMLVKPYSKKLTY